LDNPLRLIQRVADWLDDHKATRQERKLRVKFAPMVAAAERAKEWGKRDGLVSEWQFESDAVLDPLYARKAERLTAKARTYGIFVPPKPHGNEDNEDWSRSNTTGEWLLTSKAEERLRHEVKVERRASYDEFRKWTTLGFALLGFGLGLASLLVKEKRPDPCQQNYYRNDYGECVIALQKNMAQPPQAEPRTSSIQGTGSDRPTSGSPPKQDHRGKSSLPKLSP
jgi:hypothetical protein